VIFAPPVVPAHVALTATPEVVAVSATGEPLRGRGVVYVYATVRAYILFCPTADEPSGDQFALPFGRAIEFTVSPDSSFFVVKKAGAADGDLYWYLAGENSE
jgi:hypothetical protein